MRTFEVELDSRHRLPLAKIVSSDARRFRVTELESGELLLTPVISLSQRELDVLGDPGRVESIKRGIDQANTGKVTRFPAGHFTRIAGDPDSQLLDAWTEHPAYPYEGADANAPAEA